MLIIANLYQLAIMSAFFNYLRAFATLLILPKICLRLTVFNTISSDIDYRNLTLTAIDALVFS